MPSPWFGWGVPLLKRHWSLRWGQCPHCGEATFRPSHDATRMVVFLGFPVFPLGKVHVHECCQHCGTAETHALETWEEQRDEHLIPALERLSEHPSDVKAVASALEAMSRYGEADEFAALAPQVESAFPHQPETLSQLAWCHGHFARFGDATRLYQQAALLDDQPSRHHIANAYEALPEGDPPKEPNMFWQGLQCLLLPLLLLIGLTVYASQTFATRVTQVYLVNGTPRAYPIKINDEPPVEIPAHGLAQVALQPGLIRVAPVTGSAFTFDAFQFDLTPGRGARPTTAVINPDRVAVISWEELVYHLEDPGKAHEANEDQFALHAGEPFYLFYGITDHFEDPPEALELHSNHRETYRYVLHHQGNEPPVSLCSLLLGQGEMDLALDFCLQSLRLDPEETNLLPFLLELAPTELSLAFLQERLEDRPVRLSWHRHFIALSKLLGKGDSLQQRYQPMAEADPDNGTLQFLLGLTIDDPDAAYAHFLKASRLGSPEALYRVSQRQAAEGEFDKALASITQALAVIPNEAAFRQLEEDLLVATNRADVLIKRVRARLDEEPLDQSAAMMLAGLYEWQGDRERAQKTTDRFIQAIAMDGALLSEETALYREAFQTVRAEWAGDAERFLAADPGMDEAATIQGYVLKGDFEGAANAIDRASTDPFVHLLLYALASPLETCRTLAEAQLFQAIRLLEDAEEGDGPTMAAWFRSKASPPEREALSRIALPNHQRRMVLFALARRHPDSAEIYLALAKKLNYTRIFPYLVLKNALKGEMP